MKKNLLSKLVVCMFVVASMFIVSACGIQKKDVNIVSFDIDESSIPNIIVVGDFDSVGIKANVTYSDDSVETIDVTTALIPEEYHDELETPGIYKISVIFRGQSDEIEVRIVANTNLYQVNFYNGKNQLITTQLVYGGETAQLPSENMMAMEGYAFTGWSISNENIMQDTNIYGLYVNVENTLSDEAMKQALLDAEQYYTTHTHFKSTEITETDIYDGETYTETARETVNYHYDSEKQIATSQSVYTSATEKFINIFTETDVEFLGISEEECEYEKGTYEELREIYSELSDEQLEQVLLQLKINGSSDEMYLPSQLLTATNFAPNKTIEFSYELTKNKLIYTCTITFSDYQDYGDQSSSEIDRYIIKYDDTKILQISNQYQSSWSGRDDEYTSSTISYIDYNEVEFEDLISGDLRAMCDLELAMRNLAASDYSMTATMNQMSASVEYDADNKIAKITQGTNVDYVYLAGEYGEYYYKTNSQLSAGLEKHYLNYEGHFEAVVLENTFGYNFRMLVDSSDRYKRHVSTDDNENTVVTVECLNEASEIMVSYTYVFKDGELISYSNSFVPSVTISTEEVELTVPQDIRDLEGQEPNYGLSDEEAMQLLDNLMKACLQNDFIATQQTTLPNSSVMTSEMSYDADNNIMHLTTTGESYNAEKYCWVSEDYYYAVSDEDIANDAETYKYATEGWDDYVLSYIGYNSEMINPESSYSEQQITKDGNDYVFTCRGAGENGDIVYIFRYNENGLISLTTTEQGVTSTGTISIEDVDLEVPTEYKDLEISAIEG